MEAWAQRDSVPRMLEFEKNRRRRYAGLYVVPGRRSDLRLFFISTSTRAGRPGFSGSVCPSRYVVMIPPENSSCPRSTVQSSASWRRGVSGLNICSSLAVHYLLQPNICSSFEDHLLAYYF